MRTVQWLALTMLCLNCLFLTPATAEKVGKRGGAEIAPDIKPAALWDGRKEVEFHAANYPQMVRAADARFMIDDEYVLGITERGESRAYPTRFISWHHIINDKIGKTAPAFVTVTYCIVCNSGMRFDTPIVNSKPLLFDFYGLYNGVMTMYDTRTQSVWLQVEGRAVKGQLLGTTLKQRPLLDTTWGQWKKLHPDTLVMAPDPQCRDDYEPKGTVMARGYTSFPASYFRPTLTHRDTRLGMFDSVLAVSVPDDDGAVSPADPEAAPAGPSAETAPTAAGNHILHRAYPLKSFKGKTGVVNDLVGAMPLAVFYLADTETLCAVSRVLDGRTLTLEARRGGRGRTVFVDKETGTQWNVEGKGVAGLLAGKQLGRVDSHMSQWYGWVAYFPETSIYKMDSPAFVLK
jgi:hypothetical protein